MPDQHLCEYLEAITIRFPDRPAAIDQDGSVLTYRELNDQASRVAGFLADAGIQRGDRVGLVLAKSTAALTALFGILKAGAAYVPVDSTAPTERIRTILNDCSVRAVFVDSRRPELGAGIETVILVGALERSPDEEDPGVPRSVVFSWTEALNHHPLSSDAVVRHPDDLAYILYTSGSTGVPKGVTLTHRNATSYVDWCTDTFNPSENDNFSSHAPFHFDLSILDIYVSVKHGACLHLIPDALGKNPKDLASFISSRKISIWYSTPAILGLMGEFGQMGQYDYSRLRLVLFAGEVFPVKQFRRLTAFWPRPAYFNLYGPTETNVCTFFRFYRQSLKTARSRIL